MPHYLSGEEIYTHDPLRYQVSIVYLNSIVSSYAKGKSLQCQIRNPKAADLWIALCDIQANRILRSIGYAVAFKGT